MDENDSTIITPMAKEAASRRRATPTLFALYHAVFREKRDNTISRWLPLTSPFNWSQDTLL
jgi:hypothetical protein